MDDIKAIQFCLFFEIWMSIIEFLLSFISKNKETKTEHKCTAIIELVISLILGIILLIFS